MLINEYKVHGNKKQYAAIDKAIQITSPSAIRACACGWIRVASLRMICSAIVLSSQKSSPLPLASILKRVKPLLIAHGSPSLLSMINARHISLAEKGYPRFQHDNRSVEYKTTGWKLETDGKHITFTDGCGIGRVHLIENTDSASKSFPPSRSSGFDLSSVLMATMSSLP